MNTKLNVPFFNYPHVYKSYQKQFEDALRSVGTRGAFIMQRDLADFEKSVAEYSNSKYAVGVANATDGLQMGMMVAGVGPDDEVIFCSHTMVATASAIHFTGATPIPVETGPDHLIDTSDIESAITSRTKAICPTQLNGRTANMDIITAIAKKHGLLIFEDAAQALGSKFKGRFAGTFGVASCISLYPAKILGCLGDGGLVLTNSDSVFENLVMLRDHGRGHDGDVHMWGLNSRLDNLQAAFLNVQFDDYPKVIERRRAIASLYHERLSSLEQLTLPPAPDSDPNHFDVFQNYEIEAARRDDLKAFLAKNGVGTLIQWGGKAVHQFSKLGFNQSLPRTDSLFERILMIPLNMALVDDEVHYVCDQIESFYKS